MKNVFFFRFYSCIDWKSVFSGENFIPAPAAKSKLKKRFPCRISLQTSVILGFMFWMEKVLSVLFDIPSSTLRVPIFLFVSGISMNALFDASFRQAKKHPSSARLFFCLLLNLLRHL